MPEYSRDKMSFSQLEATHDLYKKNVSTWRKMLACYKGIDAIVQGGFGILRHERESLDNWKRRVNEAFGFGYSESVVNLFNFYLFKNPAKRDMGPLSDDPQWQAFELDCNLYGDNFVNWLLETQRWAGVFGNLGVLVDKSSQSFASQAEELAVNVYPYVARYFPTAILDWEYLRDANNRPYLSYIKLKDDDDIYRIWTPEYWAVFKVDEKTEKAETIPDITTGKTRRGVAVQTVKSVMSGDNTLGFIPFIWFYNVKGETRPIGISDIKDIAPIDLSIIGNLSDGEEVIDYGAFPMMRKPMREAGSGESNRGDNDDVGPTAILEFDPELPDSKPDWLDAAVGEPIGALLSWIERKTAEIYRTANIGGMSATEISTQAKSGVALQSEFQLLNGKLVQKGQNAEETELQIKRLWCLWQNRKDVIEKITVEWPKTYDVIDLAQDLQNALTAKTLVMSDTFTKRLQKQIARAMLPSADNATLAIIDEEIDNYKPVDPFAGITDEGTDTEINTSTSTSSTTTTE
jgi:hypothetical protein